MCERYDPATAKARIREILQSGEVTYSQPHAIERMAQHDISTPDVINVLRGGSCEEPEWERGAWRYRIRTSRFYVVVQFLSATELLVVTCWRIKP